MPSHDHWVGAWFYRDGSRYGWHTNTSGNSTNYDTAWTGDTGGGSSHNNMPAYQLVYVWVRTA